MPLLDEDKRYMKLLVNQIADGENPYHFDSTKEAWLRDLMTQFGAEGHKFNGPMLVDVRLTKLEPDYFLRGSLGFSLSRPCDRCAEPVSIPLDYRFELALRHRIGTTENPYVAEAESVDMDTVYFEGSEIDLGPLVQEQFFLSLPYTAVCGPHCKGICQKCGKNWNQGTCDCEETQVHSPFAVLKNLRK